MGAFEVGGWGFCIEGLTQRISTWFFLPTRDLVVVGHRLVKKTFLFPCDATGFEHIRVYLQCISNARFFASLCQ